VCLKNEDALQNDGTISRMLSCTFISREIFTPTNLGKKAPHFEKMNLEKKKDGK